MAIASSPRLATLHWGPAGTYLSRLVCSFGGWLLAVEVEKLANGPRIVSVERVDSAPAEPCRSEEGVVSRKLILPSVQLHPAVG